MCRRGVASRRIVRILLARRVGKPGLQLTLLTPVLSEHEARQIDGKASSSWVGLAVQLTGLHWSLVLYLFKLYFNWTRLDLIQSSIQDLGLSRVISWLS